jgi:hypothetical protein
MIRKSIYFLEAIELIILGALFALIMNINTNLFTEDIKAGIAAVIGFPIIVLVVWGLYLLQLKTMATLPLGCLITSLVVLTFVYGVGIAIVILISIFDLNRLILSQMLYLGDAPLEYFWSPNSRAEYVEWKQKQKTILAKQKIEKLLESKDVNRLIRILQTGNNNEKAAAADALGILGDKTAIEPLIAILKHKRLDTSIWAISPKIPYRVAAAIALGKLGDISAVEPLIAVLLNKGVAWSASVFMYPVQAAAATALGQLGDRRAIAPLTVAVEYKALTAPLQKNYEEVKAAASIALENLR